ncbi:hypothetical protein HanPI659440_Chr02g0079071 [Helianthus annuus]|nr:hypothetical protein HanPI659440_Chr02g0079071 [Helianthus annuus]
MTNFLVVRLPPTKVRVVTPSLVVGTRWGTRRSRSIINVVSHFRLIIHFFHTTPIFIWPTTPFTSHNRGRFSISKFFNF